MSNINKKTIYMTQFAILAAIEVLFCFTILGSIPIGPVEATLAMIPVIITGAIMGVRAGGAMGFIMGLCAFIYHSFYRPGIAAFLFTPITQFNSDTVFSGNLWSVVICFVPRIMGGIAGGLIGYTLAKRFPRKEWLFCGLAGALGTIVSSALVLTGFVLFFGSEWEQIGGAVAGKLVTTIIITNTIPEVIVGTLAVSGVCIPLKSYLARQN